MSKFKYHERSAETVSSRAKQSGGNYDSYLNSSLAFLKVREGQNNLRIMPPTWDVEGPFGDNWGIEVYVHRNIGPDKGNYLCLDEMRKKYGKELVPSKLGACPLCAARHELDEDDEEGQKALKAGKQILAYVINRDDEKSGPLVWRLSWTLEKEIQIRSQDKKTNAVIPLDHPDRGYDISFNREGAGLKTKYVGVEVAREESPLSEREARQEKWMQFIQDNPLTEALIFYDADYLEQVFMAKKGRKGGDADDEEEEDRPTRAKAKPSARDEEDEEEEEAPKPKRRPSRDEEEEEDEPAPKRRRAQVEDEEEEDRPRRETRRKSVEEDEDEDDRMPTDNEMKANSKRARGQREEEEEEEDEDEKPQRLKKRPVEEDEEEEEDEPKPKRRQTKPRDEEDEEEEDEPKPKGKASDRAKASLGRLKSGK